MFFVPCYMNLGSVINLWFYVLYSLDSKSIIRLSVLGEHSKYFLLFINIFTESSSGTSENKKNIAFVLEN